MHRGRLSQEEREHLIRPFTFEEMDQALKQMKTDTAPGPDGFTVSFYRAFWPQLRDQFKEMLDLLFEGRLDLWRINYGVISLIPKVKDANTIKAFRPICLLNVCFKLITKILTNRLTLVAHNVIGESQTAFIPGRFILDGVIILHEVLHEVKKTHQSGIILKLDFEKAYDKVQWSFLFDVLQKKGFDDKWIKWIKSATIDGRVAININGEIDQYFKTFRGVRQGDPLSPLLFNIVADALSEILLKAKEAGHLEGLVPHLVQGGLTHLQYADDTILFMTNNDQNVITTKFILHCFEAMSGLKINYQKSEVIVLGENPEETKRVADLFNCKCGKFPMTYLGIPISEGRLTAADLAIPPDKIEKRLSTWKCGLLSYGGKAILVNSSPMYMMGFYMLPEQTHQRMDSIRSRFFWEGIERKRKYHMVKWEALCRPKDFGGLGFLDTRVMNKVLLCKWIFKLESGQKDPCCDLLRRKYMMNGGGFFQSSTEGCSQFWRGLHEVKHWLKLGSCYDLGDGSATRFWDDVWLGDTPLKIKFPYIYSIVADPGKTVSQLWSSDGWRIDLRRSLGAEELVEWEQLLADLANVHLSTDRDRMRWKLTKSGQFSTKSLYREMTFGGIRDIKMQELWKTPMPLKIKIFVWLMLKGRIQAAHQLKKMKWNGDPLCKLCGAEEDVDHLMFKCAPARFLWCCFRDVFHWDHVPSSRREFMNILMTMGGDRE
jgi:hypothetical protein